MRYSCSIRMPEGRHPQIGFACAELADVVAMCQRISEGSQVNGGVMSLTVLDRETGSSVQIQRRSCIGFGEFAATALRCLDDEVVRPVPAHIGQEALTFILVTGSRWD